MTVGPDGSTQRRRDASPSTSRMTDSEVRSPVPYAWELAGVTALLLAVYALWIAVASPIGEFPLNDDWAYAYSVRHLLETGRLKLSNWTSATVILQIYLGSTVAWMSGGFSFTALRLTTLAMSLVGCVAAYDLYRQLRLSRSAALLGTLCIVANPIFMYLSFTFMSDIYFFSLMLVSLGLYTRGVVRGRVALLLVGSVAAALAYLSRQLGVTLPMAAALALVLRERALSPRRLAAVALVPAVVIIGHLIWLRFVHGLPWAFEAHALRHSIEALLTPGAPWTMLQRLLVTMLYAGLFTLPILAARLLSTDLPRRRTMAIAFAVWLLILAVFVVMGDTRMPMLPNLITTRGLGAPPFAKPPITPAWVFSVITVVAPVAGALQGALWSDAAARAARDRAGAGVTLMVASLLMALITVIAVVLWDEYLLVFVPAASYLGLRLGPVTRRGWAAALAVLLPMMTYSILETGECMAWNSARWAAGQKLVAQGIPAERIDAGFEWTGWYEFDEKAPRAIANGLAFAPYWPFVAKDTHTVAFRPLKGHAVLDRVTYRTPILGYPRTLYALRPEQP